MPTQPRPNLLIRLTHTGQHSDGRPNTNAVLIPDLDVGYENQDRKVPVYVPPEGHIDINASSRSMLSFEQGGIRKFTNAGILRSQMFYVPESYGTSELPPPTEYPAGTFVWNITESTAYWSTGSDWTVGRAIPSGLASGDLSGSYPSPSVVGIQGIPFESGVPANGDAALYNSLTNRWEHSPITFSGGPPTGPASGDLGGLYPAPSVLRLQQDALPTKTADGFLKRNAANTGWEEVTYGSSSNTVCQGNDVRLSDARTPVGVAGGSLAGTYPNPTLNTVGTAGTYGSASSVPVLTTNVEGRVTNVTSTAIQISEAQVTGLVTDLSNKADKTITITGAGGLTGGGDLSANRTITMPDVGTAGTYGSATQVPVLATDAKGRVTSVTPTTISGVAPGGVASGDLSGNYPDPTVDGLQGRPVSATPPDLGSALVWDGAAWTPLSGGVVPGAYLVVGVSGNHTASAWQVVLADSSAGSLTITLPLAASCVGKPINIKKISADGYGVVIDGQGSELIDGQSSITVTDRYVCSTLISDGSNWYII